MRHFLSCESDTRSMAEASSSVYIRRSDAVVSERIPPSPPVPSLPGTRQPEQTPSPVQQRAKNRRFLRPSRAVLLRASRLLLVLLFSWSSGTRKKGHSRQSCGRIGGSGIRCFVPAVSLACIDRQQYSKDSDKPRQTYRYRYSSCPSRLRTGT